MPCYINFEIRRRSPPQDGHDPIEQVSNRVEATPTSSWVEVFHHTIVFPSAPATPVMARINTDITPAQFFVGTAPPANDLRAYVLSGYQRTSLTIPPNHRLYIKEGGTAPSGGSSGGGGVVSGGSGDVYVSIGGLGPPTGIATVTPGTDVGVGQWLVIACTTAGIVRVKFSDGSTFDYPVNEGVSEIFGLFVGVATSGTTAVATYGIKQGSAPTSGEVNAATPPSGITPLTPGTPVTPGRWLVVVCTVAGKVRVIFSDDSTFDYPVNEGVSEIFGAIKGVSVIGTTATATYGVK